MKNNERWNLQDRMFSEENMIKFVKNAANEKEMPQTLRALEFAQKMHEGQTRKGKDAVPYIYHPLMLACHALSLGLEEDEIVAAALLHDTVEDCGVTAEELPVSDVVKEAVRILTKVKKPNCTKEEMEKEYYDAVAKNRIATIVKVLDRCNNISSMVTSFSNEKLVEYIDETENYIFPVLDVMKHEYPECYNAAFILKYHMKSVLESVKRLV